ncbi:hypothetical protein SLEP1_g29617 [Rubroshorea leprosula]|uniref:Gnk2-homologous domain-containing protein n=1 Tax=Rubroshorea leprosula TaxID=152421 RepID=A0AAV5JXH7_9ROSI|nr:hypothetical protein SLEP1_g29617 [Rubroshorea leprosula]
MSLFRFFTTLFVLSLRSLITEALNDSPTYLFHYCSNKTTYPSGSNYTSVQSNLYNLFLALSSNGTATAANGFYNTTFGEHPNRVYGDYLCRGDVSPSTCQNCVMFATKDVEGRCLIENEVVIWYDECRLRYSGEPSIFNEGDSVSMCMWNTHNAMDPIQFNDAVATVMNDATTRAASVALRFATKETDISAFQTLYSLAQCTLYLSSTDCNKCLRRAVSGLPSCCSGKVGGRVMSLSCHIRYEMYPFYKLSAVTALAPASPPPIVTPPAGSVINPKGKVERSLLINFCL